MTPSKFELGRANALQQEEAFKAEQKRRKNLERIASSIVEILCAEQVSLGDWDVITKLVHQLPNEQIPSITFANLRIAHERANKVSTPTTDSTSDTPTTDAGAEGEAGGGEPEGDGGGVRPSEPSEQPGSGAGEGSTSANECAGDDQRPSTEA